MLCRLPAIAPQERTIVLRNASTHLDRPRAGRNSHVRCDNPQCQKSLRSNMSGMCPVRTPPSPQKCPSFAPIPVSEYDYKKFIMNNMHLDFGGCPIAGPITGNIRSLLHGQRCQGRPTPPRPPRRRLITNAQFPPYSDHLSQRRALRRMTRHSLRPNALPRRQPLEWP
jgi:hypothetical protein